MLKWVVALFMALTLGCSSLPVVPQETGVELQVQNVNFQDAVLYVSPCESPSNCRQRLGEITGNSKRKFRLTSHQLTNTGRLWISLHLIGSSNRIDIQLESVEVGSGGAQVFIGSPITYSYMVPLPDPT